VSEKCGESEKVEVDPARLEYQTGDIGRSHSADTIGAHNSSTVRQPFKFRGQEWVGTGGLYPGLHSQERRYVEAYCVVLRSHFEGKVNHYLSGADDEGAYTDHYERLRQQPDGFYHGMLVMRGKTEWVLVGPPIRFYPAAEGVMVPGTQLAFAL